MKANQKDKGVAGLTILLSVVTTLFVIGLLIMIFALMGNNMVGDSNFYYSSGNISVANETLTSVNTAGEDFSVVDFRGVVCTLTVVHNSTGTVIGSDNYTQTNCHIANATAHYSGQDWNVSFGYTYNILNTAGSTISNTTRDIATTTDWFSIFIVITSMVVLILLTVIIITAIRGSGLMGQGGQQTGKGKKGNIGTA